MIRCWLIGLGFARLVGWSECGYSVWDASLGRASGDRRAEREFWAAVAEGRTPRLRVAGRPAACRDAWRAQANPVEQVVAPVDNESQEG
ncbi:MAG: hypothetical protein PHO07_11150 [Pirellulales bacterium]|jgi:hypothetical protein|nr:hypothetical protein [Thermoguttaceae bacterium]MDD4787723.1 hypothetical protein [Pirellulales bacterium]NLY99478.1 hypothetical protein [Pirellulaceae bacterium]